MARFLMTFIFNNFNQGWSESLYTADMDQAAAIALLETLGKPRAKLLAKSVLFTAARLSDVNIIGDSYVSADSQSWPKSSLASDVTNTALEVRLQAQFNNRRTYWLRGLPDDWVKRDEDSGKFLYTDPFVTLYTQYFDKIRDNTMFLRGITRPGVDGDHPFRRIKSIDPSGVSTEVTVTPDPFAPAFAIGEEVRIKRMTGILKPFNGKYTVLSVSTINSSFNIRLLEINILGATQADWSNAYVYSLKPGYQQITTWQALDIRTRQTGRPFGQPRGRQSARR